MSGNDVLGNGANGFGAGISNQVIVSFDTFQNTGDPTVPYVGINLNGNMTASVHSSQISFSNGSSWNSWISYNGTTLAVYLSTSFAVPSSPVVQYNLNLTLAIGKTAMYIGFGGGTGGSGEVATISNWEFVLNYVTQFRYGWDHCSPASPCQNGGTCANTLLSYTCSCVPGVVGTHCEVIENNCLPDICQNGGTCTNEINAFVCSCPPGFTGLNCQANARVCDVNPCDNGGTCVNIDNDYLCLCPPDYRDKSCSTRQCGFGSVVSPPQVLFSGLLGSYYPLPSSTTYPPTIPSDAPAIQQLQAVNFPNSGWPSGFQTANFTATWDGFVNTTVAGNHTFQVQADDGVNVYLAGVIMIPEWTVQTVPTTSFTASLKANQLYLISVEYFHQTGVGSLVLSWKKPGDSSFTAIPLASLSSYVADTQFTCTCDLGYTGDVCDEVIVPCDASFCLNGGTCIQETAGNTCFCPNGWSGSNCQTAVTPAVCAQGALATQGLVGSFYNTDGEPDETVFQSTPVTQQIGQPYLSDIVVEPPGISLSSFSAEWDGAILPPSTGSYTLVFTFTDALRVYLGGSLIVDNWKSGPETNIVVNNVQLNFSFPTLLKIQTFQTQSSPVLVFT